MLQNNIIKILMVDDHPSMLEGYKTILSYNPHGYTLSTTSAHSCREAFDLITDPDKPNYYDIAFLDYSLPVYEEENLNTVPRSLSSRREYYLLQLQIQVSTYS